jgi:DNA adenine methylase
MKPPFSYYGGKTAIADRIAGLLPPHEHYIEPFAGSLAVLLAKRPSKLETVNDLDREIVAFWRVLRDQPGSFERICGLTPHSRAEHEASFELEADDLERARRVWVRLTQGRAGTLRPTGWKFYTDPFGTSSSMPRYLVGYSARIAPIASRLAHVSLECRSALEVIKDYGTEPNALIYADPPYLGNLRSLNYQHEMPLEAEHRELAEVLSACVAAVAISGYDCPLYAELYEGWHRAQIPTFTGNGSDGHRTEILWSNRPFPQGHLFDAEGAAS